MAVMHLTMLSLKGGGEVGLTGEFDLEVFLQGRNFVHNQGWKDIWPPSLVLGREFDKLFWSRGENSIFFNENVKTPKPCPTIPIPPWA